MLPSKTGEMKARQKAAFYVNIKEQADGSLSLIVSWLETLRFMDLIEELI